MDPKAENRQEGGERKRKRQTGRGIEKREFLAKSFQKVGMFFFANRPTVTPWWKPKICLSIRDMEKYNI